MAHHNRLSAALAAYAHENANTTRVVGCRDGATMYDKHLFEKICTQVNTIKPVIVSFRTTLAPILTQNNLKLAGPPELKFDHDTDEDPVGNRPTSLHFIIHFVWKVTTGDYICGELTTRLFVFTEEGRPNIQIGKMKCPWDGHGSLNKMCAVRAEKNDTYYTSILDFMSKEGVPTY